MSNERSNMRFIGPLLGVLLVFFIVNSGVQQFQSDLADIRSTMQPESVEDEESSVVEQPPAETEEPANADVTSDDATPAPTVVEEDDSVAEDTEEVEPTPTVAAIVEETVDAESTNNESDATTASDAASDSDTNPETDAAPELATEEPVTEEIATEPIADANVEIAISKGACAGCHIIPGIRGAIGVIGPELTNIGVDAATRIGGVSAAEYLRESIIAPDAFIAPECPNGACPEGVMLPSFTAALSDAEIEQIVNYLLLLRVEGN